MNLGFSQVMFGKPNNFISKIIWSLSGTNQICFIQYRKFVAEFKTKFGKDLDVSFIGVKPKDHTIRSGNRWKAGNKIHFVINSRTKDRFQFAPICEVKSVQTIEIKRVDTNFGNLVIINIDGKPFPYYNWFNLAQRDGFESVEDFLKYFNTDFNGQIIHWTDKPY